MSIVKTHCRIILNVFSHVLLFEFVFSLQVFRCIKSWGATGVLLEWEDTFPYILNLKDIGSQNGDSGSAGDGLYSIEEVQEIFRLAKENCLEAVSLKQ